MTYKRQGQSKTIIDQSHDLGMAAAPRLQKDEEGKNKHEFPAAAAVSSYMNEMVNARDLQEVIETQNGM